MNKFAEWVKTNDKKQRGVAQKLDIGTTTLHEILKKGLMPSLKLAYKIEQNTKGAVTVYDWIDEPKQADKQVIKTKIEKKSKKITR